jgi:hypothetical protein
MDDVTIQKIAAEIARYVPSYAWVLLAIQVALTLVAAAAGAFLVSTSRREERTSPLKQTLESEGPA